MFKKGQLAAIAADLLDCRQPTYGYGARETNFGGIINRKIIRQAGGTILKIFRSLRSAYFTTTSLISARRAFGILIRSVRISMGCSCFGDLVYGDWFWLSKCLTRPALGKKPESCMRAFASKRKSPAQGGEASPPGCWRRLQRF